MKIILTVNAAWNIWNFRRPLIDDLIGRGHKVFILAPHDESVTRLEELGCAHIPLAMSAKGLNPLEGALLFRRMRTVFRDIGPDAVLSFTIKNNLFGALAAKSLGIPFLPNVTGLGTAFLSGGLLERVAVALYRQAFRGLPVVFFQNEDDRDLFLRRRIVRAPQCRLLPGSGIDLKRFEPAPFPGEDSEPVFLMIARLLRDKGVLEYVEAARIVKTVIPQARFQLLGATDAANRTAIGRDTVAAWEDEGLIEYLGATDDVRTKISAAHCVVLPSYREGAPRTLIEAAAMARPIITTEVPGCRAVVEDGVTGFSCQVRSATSLAETCLKFLELAATAQEQMGEAGRAKMERQYDQRFVVEAYRNATDAILKTASETPALATS
ncbi:glycosyltransferase family 4 protein [Qipengyuania gaetbuli]|uniref:glycosyltransferase family 4 protein n=1 Tax=Qipengyuania gaetbuli TaxID=266952 RepID=UPI001C9946C5|nr:glycosyltransferase family 4 protein [Qipengyuania gaetbuli]MBY6016091.1 glycosyltransferase family 4 protein [Qipengyuania gaetbuli]